MPRSRIAEDRTCCARRTSLRKTAAEESIGLCRIARVQAPSDYATRWCTRSGCAWGCSGCWRRAPARLQRVALRASSRATGAVAEVLREVRRGVFLHARCGGCFAAVTSPVNHVEAPLRLLQSQLKVGIPAPREFLPPQLNVEMRLGAVPLTDVNMPKPALTRYRSSQ